MYTDTLYQNATVRTSSTIETGKRRYSRDCSAGRSEEEGRALSSKEFMADFLQDSSDFIVAKSEIQEHSKRYFWKRNNYFSTQVVTPEMVLLECLALGARYSLVELSQKIGETTRRLADNQELRSQIYNQLGSYYRSVVDVLARNGQMKDTRKMVISLANHAVDLFLREIANRSGYTLEDVHCLLPEELSECLSSPLSLREEIKGRHKATVVFWGEQDTAPPEFSFNSALRRDETSPYKLPPSTWVCLAA